MKKQLLRFGLISGVCMATFLSLSMYIYSRSESIHSGYGEIIGYSSMLLIMGITMVLAIRSYEAENPGAKAGKRILLCLGIAGITGLFYLVSWALVYHFVMPDFIDKMLEGMRKQVAEGKLSQKEFNENLEFMGTSYKNPVIFSLITLAEVLPVGILLSLIIPFVYKGRKKQAS
jgi:hypothetical protein